MNKQLIYGRHPILEAIESGKTIEKIFLQRGIEKEFTHQIINLSRQKNITLQFVPVEKINRLTGGNHQGVVAFLSLINYYNLEDVLPHIYEKGETPLFLILDGITDVGNFGAIARTAEGAGVHALIIPQKGIAQINADAMKSSAGALNKIYVCREKDLMDSIKFLKLNGVQIIATEVTGQKNIFECDFKIPTAVVLGSEGSGASPEILKKADEIAKIPMMGTMESFNVSVSCGMILYESMKQRMGK